MRGYDRQYYLETKAKGTVRMAIKLPIFAGIQTYYTRMINYD